MSKKNFSANKNVYLICLALLGLGLLSFIYWGNQKEVWFCDEIYTYESANGFEQAWPAQNTGVWQTKEEMEAFFSADSQYLNLEAVSNRLYSDHVPLYFWLFRMVSFYLFPGSGSIWIGLCINLPFYLMVLGLGFWFFHRLTKSPWISAMIMVLTGITHRLMIEQAVTLRMYMLLLWAEVLLVLAGLLIVQENHRAKMRWGSFVLLFVTSVTGFLTHYDFWIFYAALAFIFCLYLLYRAFSANRKIWKTREFYCILAWVGNFIASLLVTIWLFPYCRWNLNRGKGKLALDAVFVFSGEKLAHIGWGYRRLSESILGENIPVALGLCLLFGAIAAGAFILYKRKDFPKLTGLLLVAAASQLYQFIVCFTLPDMEEERYLWGAYTLMMWCMVYGCWLLLQTLYKRFVRADKGRIGQIAAVILLIGITLVQQSHMIREENGIYYLSRPDKDISLLQENKELPWIVYGPTLGVYSYYDWLIPNRICFLSLEQTEKERAAIAQMTAEDSFILYAHEGYFSEAINYLEANLGKELSAEYLTKSTHLTVYLVSHAEK